MLDATRIGCPYCGEEFEITVDCSMGGQQYVEDCPVCCQPIDLSSDVDIEGNLIQVTPRRNDD